MRRGGKRSAIALGESYQIGEIDVAVIIKIAVGEGLTGRAVILCQGNEVGEADRAIMVRVAGEDEEIEGEVGGRRIPRGVADGVRAQYGAIIAVREPWDE